MKYFVTVVACFVLVSISAQTFSVSGYSINITADDKTETFAFMTIPVNSKYTMTFEMSPVAGPIAFETWQSIGELLSSEFKLNNSCSYEFFDNGEAVITFERAALWRAGQHKLNALGWGAGGATVSVVVFLIASPAAGLVIGGFSGVMAIVQSVKSAKAMQEAAGDYEAQFNQKEPAN